jgi:hypothetical protein
MPIAKQVAPVRLGSGDQHVRRKANGQCNRCGRHEPKIREISRLMDLNDLRGVEFLRLLRLAHSGGLLPELLQAGGCLGHQEPGGLLLGLR